MPTIDVCDIWLDAWAKTAYEGKAKIIAPLPDTPSKTINGVTCDLYWVRFWYTEINLRRWLDVSDIETWYDYTDRVMHPHDADPATSFDTYRLYFVELCDNIGGETFSHWWAPRFWTPDDTLLGIGCEQSISTFAHPDSRVRIQLYAHENFNPAFPAVTLLDESSYAQLNTYSLLYFALPTPKKITQLHTLTARIRVTCKQDVDPTAKIYYKAPFLRYERIF